ncbi:MAG: class I SAM-dependent methyltransferase [bacterium]
MKLITDGYNKIARTYLVERQKLKTDKYVKELIERLPDESIVLDVGCGAGVPVDDALLRRGFGVVGIDTSEEQIKMARKLCKGGDYMVRDINLLIENEYQVDAVVCLYTMFHIPREQHRKMLAIFASFLKKGGCLLLTMGDRDFEGEHEMLGTKMWSSQWGREKNTKMVVDSGFEILKDEINTTASERHQVILAIRK